MMKNYLNSLVENGDIEQSTADAALNLYLRLCSITNVHIIPPSISPDLHKGVILSFNKYPLYLEFEICGYGKIEVFSGTA